MGIGQILSSIGRFLPVPTMEGLSAGVRSALAAPPRRGAGQDWMMMDECIRIGPWSIGLDGIVGIVPGIGDMAGGLVGLFIVARALQQGIARSAVTRMVINVGLDTLVGSIPFVGDIFDFAWKSNVRNVEIYKEAFNHAWEEYESNARRRDYATREETAHKVAWAAVKKAYRLGV